MFSASWLQRNVNKPGHGSDLSKWFCLAVEIVLVVLIETNTDAHYNISQVMQLLADSSDDSGIDLNLSDLDVGGNSSTTDVKRGDIPAPRRRLNQHFRQQVLACHLVVVV